jgi:hypothetical protein
MSSIINLIHIFVIVPLLYALYYYREKLSENICNLLIVISIIGLIYHFMKLKNLPDNKKHLEFVYMIHIIGVFPLLICIGLHCQKAPRFLFEILLLNIFAALGYHIYNYIKYRK